MIRDDSILYTGFSSASLSTAKEQKQRKERREKNVEKRSALLPAGEIVKAEIQKEIDMVKNIDYLNVESMLNDEHFRAEIMARKKFLERLIALKNRFDTLLRDNKHG